MHINPDVNAVRRVITPEPSAAERRRNAFFDHLEGAGLRGADLVMPVYRPILPYLARHGVTRVEVCYNILSPRLRPKTDYRRSASFRIVCVGRLIPEKNPTHLIRAVAAMRDVELTIVGDGPERPALESLVQTLGVAPRVCFRPAVPNDELCDLLPTFDLFAVHTEYWELNKSVLEALLTGLPVVINRRAGPPVPELEHADFVEFVANSTDGYAAAIRALSTDDAAREALGRRALAHARAHWAPDVTEAKVVGIYRRLMRPAA